MRMAGPVTHGKIIAAWPHVLFVALLFLLLPSAREAAQSDASSVTHRALTVGVAGRGRPAHATRRASALGLPLTVDLSRFAPPVADQGALNDCGSWAIGYYLRGWYAVRAGNYPSSPGAQGGFAPMYLYSQVARGSDGGGTLEDNLDLLVDQGIAPRSAYYQGDGDTHDAPTQAERLAARPFRIGTYTDVLAGRTGAAAATAIRHALDAGMPLVLSVNVYQPLLDAAGARPLIERGHGHILGYHALFALAYDRAGVWVENSWGTGWGRGGWAELSWDFIAHDMREAYTVALTSGANDQLSTFPASDPSPAPARTTPAAQCPSGWTCNGATQSLVWGDDASRGIETLVTAVGATSNSAAEGVSLAASVSAAAPYLALSVTSRGLLVAEARQAAGGPITHAVLGHAQAPVMLQVHAVRGTLIAREAAGPGAAWQSLPLPDALRLALPPATAWQAQVTETVMG